MFEKATNRDLYLFIAALVQRRAEDDLTLEAYLENLRGHADRFRGRKALPLSDFAALLESAFAPAKPAGEPRENATEGYLLWEQRVAAQIRDVREMKEEGTLDNEYRYFGVDAPRGSRWYNFDPCTYLECAAAGTFGGWQEGDDTARGYVPGEVAVVDASGAVTSMDPRDIDDPVHELPEITWEELVYFLTDGQCYE